MLDSYDSFVFNLVQYLGELGADPVVHRNDAITIDEAVDLAPDGVLLSPGPGRPEDAGILCAAVETFGAAGTPVLGVCLGQQAIGHAHGASIVGATELMHGKTSPIDHDGQGSSPACRRRLTATRYHSLTIDPDSLPDASRSPPPLPTARSWASATGSARWRGCSSTPRACSPRAGTTCCATGWRLRRRRPAPYPSPDRFFT